MSVTASRLGSAPITIDWTNFSSVPAGDSNIRMPSGGNGHVDAHALNTAWSALKQRFASGEVGFYDSPIDPRISAAQECQELATKILKTGQFTDCLFLGIGGSSLGPLSLLNALPEKRANDIRFHICESPDPLEWKSTLSELQPSSTLVCAVTKSGTTFETLSQLLLAMDWLGEARLKTHLVAITDPEKGDLRAFAKQRELMSLPIAPSIGGRFSVFSPVGLFAAALGGLSVTDFLQGAKQIRDHIEKGSLEKNPIFILAHELIRHGARRPVHVCMPYSTRLRSFGLWFVQLWGESLGKDGKGYTPLAAVGPTDQHSILQLLRDGPDDKVTAFITVDQADDPVRIPNSPINLPAFKILEGRTLYDLMRYEYEATSLVLTRQRRPNFSIKLDRLDARNMGALYFTFCVLTSVTGTLMGVNPYDQPGVEEGKVYIRKSLSAATLAPESEEEDENSPVNRLRRHQSTETE
ncbi:MAG: glucose-6-phosphate isomerase [Oligoflexia bacterium]|nr:glucose-6-phosphate isomerase [Oligoflexia bacterium]